MKVVLKTFFVAMLTLLTINSYAQESHFQFGIKASSNHSNISGDLKNLSKSNALGFSAGVVSKYHFDKLYLQAELLYSEKKSSVNENNIASAKWKSIDLPLSIGYQLLDLKLAKLNVYGGGVYSHIINDKLDFVDNVKNVSTDFTKSNIKVQAGIGVVIGDFGFELSYMRSLNNLSKDFKSKTNDVNLGISYFFL